MADPFVAEIRILPYTFPPRDWARCDGALVPIAQHTALFSVIGNTYGGDQRTTVGLPNLQGRAPMHPGSGPGLTARRLGEVGGSSTIELIEAQMPIHTHTMRGDDKNKPLPFTGGESTNDPQNNVLGRGRFVDSVDNNAYIQTAPDTSLQETALGTSGRSLAHENMQPYLGMQFCICLNGIHPSRP